jgi:F0F1-type ATP synthase membrane subunit a
MFRENFSPIIKSTWLYLQYLVVFTQVAASWCLGWVETTAGLLLIPTRIWLIPSRNSTIINLLINKLHQEIKTVLRKGNENKGNSFILTSLFLIILRNNFLGLFPYIFTRTTYINSSTTNMNKIYIIRINKKFQPYIWTLSTTRHTNHELKLRIYSSMTPAGSNLGEYY